MSRLSKPALAQKYAEWDTTGRSTPVTPTLLLGLFYLRYKQRYKLYPVSNENEDLMHFQVLLNQFSADDPTLSPYMVEALFTEKNFQSLRPSSFSNSRVIAGWRVVEKATQLRGGFGAAGEQSEFAGSRAFGVTRV